jgi:ferrous iron transport protein A
MQITCASSQASIAYDNHYHLQAIPMKAVPAEYLAANACSPVNPVALADCAKGQPLVLTALCANPAFGANDAAVTARLKALGFVPGAALQVIGYGLFGRDPLAVQVNGTKFALRRAEALKLLVIPL